MSEELWVESETYYALRVRWTYEPARFRTVLTHKHWVRSGQAQRLVRCRVPALAYAVVYSALGAPGDPISLHVTECVEWTGDDAGRVREWHALGRGLYHVCLGRDAANRVMNGSLDIIDAFWSTGSSWTGLVPHLQDLTRGSAGTFWGPYSSNLTRAHGSSRHTIKGATNIITTHDWERGLTD